MSRHAAPRSSHRARRRWLGGWLGAAVLLALVVVVVGGPGTYALFTDTATVSAGSASGASTAFTSGSIATPVLSRATQTQTTSVVVITWSATSVGTLGGTAGAYEVYRYAAATGGTGTLACSTSGALTCDDTSKPTSTVYYELRARVGTNWQKTSARVSYTPDATAPTLAINNPAYGCGNDIVSCGTASDTGGGTVALVEYNLVRKAGTSYSCWNGSSWVANASSTCSYRTATGTTSWRVPGSLNTASANSQNYDSYTLTVRATDSYGNLSAPTSVNYLS